MTTKKTLTHYARIVNGQPNNNAVDVKLRKNWVYPEKASANDVFREPSGYIQSSYDYSKVYLSANELKMIDAMDNASAATSKSAQGKYVNEYKRPWTLAARDFRFDISGDKVPEGAYITNITFTVKLSITGKITVKAPYARFNCYKGTKTVKDNINNHTGWEDGYYYYNPNKNLSQSSQEIKYVMSGTEFAKRGYTAKSLYDDRFGIDLRWFIPSKQPDYECEISIKWVKCVIEYELPKHTLTFDTVTSESAPRKVTVGDEFTVVATHKNSSKSSDGLQEIQIDLPPNTVVVDAYPNYNKTTNIWTVNAKANSTNKLTLKLRRYGVGVAPIEFTNPNVGYHKYYIYSLPASHDVGEVTPYPSEAHEGHTSCICFRSKVFSVDGEVSFDVNVDTVYTTNPSLEWELLSDYTSEGVSISSSDDNSIVFNVPQGDEADISFKCCFIPLFVGDTSVSVKLEDNRPVEVPYTVLEPYTYIVSNNTDYSECCAFNISLLPDTIVFNNHRVLTSTELGATVIECGVADYDGTMSISDCTLSANIWEKIAYIGCVPLEHSHYDPDSTFSNDLVNQSYKNKVYMGKSGELDETISLKFKARPKDGLTLQGLVELDKPTPINTVPLAFEGDILNHRGWAVLSEIKAKRTNPLWYDYEADVKYITHDINAKFEIKRESAPINTVAMPDLLVDTFTSGESLSSALDIFTVDTDGGYYYDEEGEEGTNNVFSLDERQHLLIKTNNALSQVSDLRFTWYSNEIDEFRENNLSRIFRLIDKKTGNIILSYEYTNFVFEEDYVTCDIIINILNEAGGYTPRYYEAVDLRTELEVDPINEEDIVIDVDVEDDSEEDFEETPNDEPYDDEETYEEGYIAPTFNPSEYDITTIYGSSLNFYLNKNILRIVDEGYNGREVYEDNIQLVDGEYIFETYWENYNEDGMTEDIISYIDINLSETVLNTMYASQYGKLLVSPFPVPRKTLLFTRESEEGTIYYYNDDGTPFKYRLEPYYQYHCGTDLVNSAGTSLFNLNNSFSTYYIENGLVRLGFNKYNGEIYLAKYDIVAKEWITTHYLHMNEDTVFSLKYLSDDKIIIQAGTDTYFTIWRGHPYIMVNNPNSYIHFDNKFGYAYGDYIDGVRYTYPIIHSFLNTDNLLLSCIGGKALDYDCITVDDDVSHTGTNHSLSVKSKDYYANVPDTLSVTTDATTGVVHYIVDGVDVGSASYPFDLDYTFGKESSYEVQAVYTGDDDNLVVFSAVKIININQIETETLPTGKYKLKIVSAPSKFTYRDKKQVVVQVTRNNQPVGKGVEVELQTPIDTISAHTDANGKVYITNNNHYYVPGKYQWGARLYDLHDEDQDDVLIYEALKWISIEKGTPSFSHSAENTGKVNVGKKLYVRMTGAVGGWKGAKIIYTINGGTKKIKKTNDKGEISISMTTKGTKKIKVMYAESTRYKAASKTFTVQVV